MEQSAIKCPQCNTKLNNPTCRLVQDSCGHKKCRLCLLNDETKCKLCAEVETNNEPISFHTAVITYQNKICDDIASESTHTNNKFGNGIENKLDIVQEIKTEVPIPKRSYNIFITPSHVTLNEELKLYTCSFCKKSFTSRSQIKYHLYCNGAKKPFQCDVCKKEFIVKYHLQTHLLIHSEKKPFSCDKCTKAFISKSKLNRHKLIHNDERCFVCPECGKSFKNKENLRTHSSIHKPEKAYVCDECKAKFNNSSNFKKHLQIHNKEKAHMCDTCGKRFKLKWALSVHKKSHLKFRNNQCAICSKSFVHTKDLHRHQLIHLDAKGYTCGICNASFKRKDNLHRHSKNTHPGKKPVVIKNIIKKKIIQELKPINQIVDNPNAINVITASPAFNNAKLQKNMPKEDRSPVINAPLKLAFKTSAFKNNYNIHRNYIEPADDVETVNIYEKILLQNVPPPASNQQKKTVPEEELYKCPKILSTFNTPGHYETSFDNKKHAVIKNIKFKLPPEYTNLRLNEIKHEVASLLPYSDDNVTVDEDSKNNISTGLVISDDNVSVDEDCKNNIFTGLVISDDNVSVDEDCKNNISTGLVISGDNVSLDEDCKHNISSGLCTATTSVIVNTQIAQQNDMHWRRRTAQNFNKN